MDNYILAANWNKSNIQDRLWYCMEEIDKDTMLLEEKISFGDKVYVIKTKTTYICGNDNTWHEQCSRYKIN